MEKNVGGLDRKARLALGPVLLVVGVAAVVGLLDLGLTGTLATAAFGLAILVGGVFLVTGTTQKCPANELAGVNTCDRQ